RLFHCLCEVRDERFHVLLSPFHSESINLALCPGPIDDGCERYNLPENLNPHLGLPCSKLGYHLLRRFGLAARPGLPTLHRMRLQKVSCLCSSSRCGTF